MQDCLELFYLIVCLKRSSSFFRNDISRDVSTEYLRKKSVTQLTPVAAPRPMMLLPISKFAFCTRSLSTRTICSFFVMVNFPIGRLTRRGTVGHFGTVAGKISVVQSTKKRLLRGFTIGQVRAELQMQLVMNYEYLCNSRYLHLFFKYKKKCISIL